MTFAPGLVGPPLQRCCPQTSSPHILLCSPLPPAGNATGDAMPAECWFGLYSVSLAAAGQQALPGPLPPTQQARAAQRRLQRRQQQQRHQPATRAAVQRALAEASLAAAAAALRPPRRKAGGPRGRSTLQARTDAAHAHAPTHIGGELAVGAVGAAGSAPLSAAAALVDGSLVWLWAKAFSRYCSVSLDGSLLCVSAAASNATRNLFVLDLHQRVPPQLPLPLLP